MKQQFSRVMLIIILLAVVSCGGGGGGGGESSTPNGNPEGTWNGTFTESGSTYEFSGLIYDGEILAFSTEAGVIYKGTYAVSGNTFTADVTGYEIGGGRIATSRISATFSEEDRITASFTTNYTSGSRTTGSISMNFDERYNRPSSYALIAGDWSVTDGLYTADAVIDNNGALYATDSDGCVFEGTVSILDQNHNLYGLNADVTECGSLDGLFEGFIVLSDTDAENDTFTYGASSSNYIIFNSLTRQ